MGWDCDLTENNDFITVSFGELFCEFFQIRHFIKHLQANMSVS